MGKGALCRLKLQTEQEQKEKEAEFKEQLVRFLSKSSFGYLFKDARTGQ